MKIKDILRHRCFITNENGADCIFKDGKKYKLKNGNYLIETDQDGNGIENELYLNFITPKTGKKRE